MFVDQIDLKEEKKSFYPHEIKEKKETKHEWMKSLSTGQKLEESENQEEIRVVRRRRKGDARKRKRHAKSHVNSKILLHSMEHFV